VEIDLTITVYRCCPECPGGHWAIFRSDQSLVASGSESTLADATIAAHERRRLIVNERERGGGRVLCPFCVKLVPDLGADRATVCSCGHRADLPATECDCPACGETGGVKAFMARVDR
jgi:hypothetical protein